MNKPYAIPDCQPLKLYGDVSGGYDDGSLGRLKSALGGNLVEEDLIQPSPGYRRAVAEALEQAGHPLK